MGDVLGYARVSTGDQDVAGQELRLRQAGAAKVFTDVRSGRSMDRPQGSRMRTSRPSRSRVAKTERSYLCSDNPTFPDYSAFFGTD